MALNQAQFRYLASVSGFTLQEIGNQVVGFQFTKNIHKLKIPYKEFKDNMGLEDLRLHWLLGTNNIIAGGAVLSWIDGQNNHNDIDFFFKDYDSAQSFLLFIQNYGFVPTKETNYALTCFHEESKLILQIVGGSSSLPFLGNSDMASRFFGLPHDILSRFDMNICRIAVGSEWIYTNSQWIRDLLTRSIRIHNAENISVDRIVKYKAKGYYIADPVLEYKNAYQSLIPDASSW